MSDRKHDQIPAVRVVKGGGDAQPLRVRVTASLDPARARLAQVVGSALALWPILLVLGILFGLAWSMAMAQSP